MIIRTRFVRKSNGKDSHKVRVVATTRAGRRVQKTYNAAQFLTQHGDAHAALDASACQFTEEWLQRTDALVAYSHNTRQGFAYRVEL